MIQVEKKKSLNKFLTICRVNLFILCFCVFGMLSSSLQAEESGSHAGGNSGLHSILGLGSALGNIDLSATTDICSVLLRSNPGANRPSPLESLPPLPDNSEKKAPPANPSTHNPLTGNAPQTL